jgi:ElaB/YqjD/DUF883 family membrane-anchored ribosome-binding protein
MTEAYSPTRSAEALQERPHDLSDPAGIARGLASEVVEDAKESVDRITAYTRVLARSPGVVGDIVRFVRANPLEALAVTVGVAFVAGAFLKIGDSAADRTGHGGRSRRSAAADLRGRV